ncbi:MAG: hypothetical protein NTW16_07055 [Bacteroidetes bacterium]|nr:hypothetical protein [Bacteroidota bacterium]
MKPFLPINILILFIVISSVSCKKNKDYRDTYTGNYHFTVNEHIVNLQDSTTFDTIYYYSGQITNGEEPEQIIISYGPNKWLNFVLSESGKFHLNSTALGWGAYGTFNGTDKVSFLIYNIQGTQTIVDGTKI